jgi:apolipoprotein N-acyltransferase
MQIINQYSLIIVGLIGLIAMALVLMRSGKRRGRMAVLAAIALALLAGWVAVRPTATPAAAVSQVRAQIGQGLPVLLELQSPY